jgi:hypothetical protein
MKSLLVFAVTLAVILSATIERASAQSITGETPSTPSHVAPAKLENGDIVDMVKAGLPDDVIIAKIQGSTCNFDTSSSALASLKSAQVSNGVILAVVKKSNPSTASEERANSSAPSSAAAATVMPDPPKATASTISKGCMAVKPIGSHAFRNVMLFGVAGAFISHMQYQVVDAVDYPAKIGQKYHGNDLQTIQGSGTKVVLLDKHYSADELHMACH